MDEKWLVNKAFVALLSLGCIAGVCVLAHEISSCNKEESKIEGARPKIIVPQECYDSVFNDFEHQSNYESHRRQCAPGATVSIVGDKIVCHCDKSILDGGTVQ